MTPTQKTPITDMVRERQGDYLALVEQLELDHNALLAAAEEALLALRGHNLAAMVEPAERLEPAIAQAEGRTA